jgi:hypothetical protein
VNQRDFFAGLAMHAILTGEVLSHESGWEERLAEKSFDIATAMMNARARAGVKEEQLEDSVAKAITEAVRDLGSEIQDGFRWISDDVERIADKINSSND